MMSLIANAIELPLEQKRELVARLLAERSRRTRAPRVSSIAGSRSRLG